MPVIEARPPAFKPSQEVEVNWEDFSDGWNDIFKPTELKPTELAQADNLMLIGKGTPTGRWGSAKYNLAGEDGRVRLLSAYYDANASLNQLLAITDTGLLTKKAGASYNIVTGASFASGANMQSVLLGRNMFIARASLPLVKYDGTNLIPYTALGVPTNVSVARLSNASGTTTWSWIITALSQTGETLPSMSKSFASLPLDLSQTAMKITWNTVSAASGVLQGYNIYRGFPGDETLVGFASPDDTEFLDVGGAASNVVFPPDSDTTGGPRATSALLFDDRIVLVDNDNKSRVLISARYPYHDRFTAADGGGYALVSPDDGDEIIGLGIAGNQGMGSNPPPASAILVFKKRSVHRIILTQVQVGNFVILDPQTQLLTSSNGCSAAETIQAVENDTFYFGRKGLYTVGQEPNFLNQIRTNELSARIRNYIQNLSQEDFRDANAGYMDNKYLLSFPGRKETIIYDRERAAFMGPWKTPFGITRWLKYFDNAGKERFIAGTTHATDGPFNREFSPGYRNDSGEAFSRVLRTRKDDMGDWSIMKVLQYLYVMFRNVRGSATVNILVETRKGTTVTTKSFSIASSLGVAGWGSDQWGTRQWGTSEATVQTTGDELVRYARLFKTVRIVQIEVISTGANDNWEFLGTKFTGRSLGKNSLPSTYRV